MMKRLIFSLTILVTFTSMYSGCWDYKEYDAMIQIIGMGIDYNKNLNEYEFTVQYVSTSRQSQIISSGGNRAIVYSAYGKNFMDAVSNIEQVLNKKMFLGYIKIMVLGNDLAKYKLADFISYLDRTPVLRNTIYVIISNNKAEDLISTFDVSKELSSSEQIYNIVNVSENTSTTYPVTLEAFIEMLAISGFEATAPYIVNIASDNGTKSTDVEDEDIKYDEEKAGDLRVKGTAVFKKDKLTGWLNYKESRGFKFITGKNMQAYIASNMSDGSDIEETFYYHLKKVKSSMKPEFKDGKPIMNINVNVTAELRKYSSISYFDMLTPEKMGIAEKKLADSINSDIQAVLSKCQNEYNSDIFGFGFAFFRKNMKLWQNEYEAKWDDIFPKLQVNTKIHVSIKNSGTNYREFIIK